MTLTFSGSPVGSEVFTALAVLAISLVVLLIIRYYLPLRSTPAYLLVPVFFALWLPACIVILMPIDLASSARTDDEKTRGIWLPDRLLLIWWRITYWLTFTLTWFILPILAEYSDSGYREPRDKILYSLRSNAQYHLMVFGSGIICITYVFIFYGASLYSLKAMVMALAYCWGLALAIYLMGHGLVAIPRRLFRNASISGRLRRIQSHAPTVYEKLEDAEATLEELEVQVFELGKRKTGSAAKFQDWIDDLVDLANLPESQPRHAPRRPPTDDSRILPTVITQKYMADLTRRLVRAKHARIRYLNEWDRLIRSAVQTQAILDSAASKKLDFGDASPHAGFWDRLNLLTPYTRYLTYYHVIPYLSLFAGGFLTLCSLSIVWSELLKAAFPSLSVIRLTVVHHWTGDTGQVGFAGQVIAALWLLYMCAAALTSITEVKVWRGRALVRRNTAHESAFWYASQVARLSVPLSFNFITFLSPEVYTKTMFYHFLGAFIQGTTASTWFDYLFPVLILVPVLATLFGLYGRVRRLFGFGGFDALAAGDDGDEETASRNAYGTGTWREGRDLIERELNGTSLRGRRAENAGLLSGRSAVPVLSVPRVEGRASPSPMRANRPAANTSARRVGATAVREEVPDDENFFEGIGHRFKNTIDTLDTPKWFQELGQGIKKPKWMGGGGEEAGGSGSGSRPGLPGRASSDVRRWFGGGEGRIRL
ncbi:LMBR1 domain-containing protein [Coniochaeta ligniaria NRRL 30616]|uniref:LMBR1 domain-containing protein n=1 Tax=Coniochaeta ligniaria NRRL 30616 TaxID=1408157 RepID=A0A1J7J096_9PEZI|nr:LMBR1 domain-containing protein [Coniochaeta ligniaria NRRL 30616]